MKIATYNCNGVRARINNIIDWLKNENPDILALQEIKVVNELFPHQPFNNLGYTCAVRGKKAHAGVALISKTQPDEIHAGFRDGDESEEPRIIAGRWGKLHLINTYCPQGRDPDHEQFQYKLEWFKRQRNFFDKHYKTRQQVVWVGDFNVAPEPIDVYDSKKIMGHVCHRPEVFDALDNVRGWGFIDLFRKFHAGEENQFTYWDFRAINAVERNVGWRVDHVYASGPAAKKARNCWIDTKPRMMEKPSDHTFLVAEFDV